MTHDAHQLLPQQFQNSAEAFVFEVCQRTFLSLWSYANPRRANSKELCDVLIVSEPEIIVLSVKSCTPSAAPSEIEEARWIRKVLDKSIKQLYGARRELRNLQAVVKSDGSPGLPLPSPAERRYHLVAVQLGRQTSHVTSDDFGKGFVHFLAEDSFFIVLRALDTVSDLVAYLTQREKLHDIAPRLSLRGREEDLLAIYLHSGRAFPPEVSTHVVPHGMWDHFCMMPYYQAKVVEDRGSYRWDRLIEYFGGHALSGTLEMGNSLSEDEEVFRVLARESRFGRRMLADSLFEFWDLASAGKVRSRICTSPQGVTYVFVDLPPWADREERRRILFLRCFAARDRIREHAMVVGLGFNVRPAAQGFAEDILLFHVADWTSDHQREAQTIKKELGYFQNPKVGVSDASEYPTIEG